MAEDTSLYIDLRARTAKLEHDFDRAQKKIRGKFRGMGRGVQGDLQNAFARIRKIAAVAGVAVGVNQIQQAILGAVAAGSQLQTTADKIGLTTSSLQELRLAGEQFNIGQNVTDMALQRFSRRLGEADQGLGELRATLDQYNISTRDADGNMRSTVSVLFEYAEVVKAASSSQEKLRIGFKGFDSEGAAFVNVLQDGAAGLAQMAVEAYALGNVLESEQIQRLNEASQGVTRFKQGWSNFFSGLVANGLKLSDALGITGLNSELRSIEKKMQRVNTFQMAGGPTAPNAFIYGAGTSKRMDKLQLEFDVALAELVKKNSVATKRINAELNAALEIRKNLPEGTEGYFGIIDRRIDRLRASLLELGKAQTELNKQYPEAAALAQELVVLEGLRARSVELTASETASLNSILTSTITPLERYQAQVELLEKAIEAMPYRTEEFEEAMKRLKQTYEESLNPETINIFVTNWEDLTKNLPSSLSEALIEGEDSMDRFLANILQKMAAAQLEAAIVAPFLGALGLGGEGGLGGILSGIFGGGGSVATPPINGYANGGRPAMNKPALVGERGPELWMPDRPGTIIPNHELGGARSGSPSISITQNLTFSTNLADVREQIRSAAPAIVQATQAAIADTNRRRGR
jgi:hypothetical protein